MPARYASAARTERGNKCRLGERRSRNEMNVNDENRDAAQLPLDAAEREFGPALRRLMAAGKVYRASKRAAQSARRDARRQKAAAVHEPFDNARQCPPGDND